jgi:hypothetical protein
VRGAPYEGIAAAGPLHSFDHTMMDDLSVDAVEAAAGELVRAGGLA